MPDRSVPRRSLCELEALDEAPLRLGVVLAPPGGVSQHPQCHDIPRRLSQALPQQPLGGLHAVAGQREDRIAELWRLVGQPRVALVSAIALERFARGMQPGCELAPAIGEPGIERHRAPEGAQGFCVASRRRVSASELELHDGRVELRARERLEHRRGRRRIPELAPRGREQQAGSRVTGGSCENAAGALRGGRGVRLEQQRRAHELEIGRGTRCQIADSRGAGRAPGASGGLSKRTRAGESTAAGGARCTVQLPPL